MVYSAWKLFGTLVNELLRSAPKSQHEKELNLLLDTVVLNRPRILAEGFIVLRADSAKEKTSVAIFSLRDLEIGKAYITQKDTCVLRCSEGVVQLGQYFTSATAGKITIPVPTKDEDNSEQNQRPSMKGELMTEIFLLTLEKFTCKPVKDGMIFFEQGMKLGRNVSSLDDLALGMVYVSQDNYVQLKRLPKGRISFRFSSKQDILPADVHNPTVDRISAELLREHSTPRRQSARTRYTAVGKRPACTPIHSSRKRQRGVTAKAEEGSPAKRLRSGRSTGDASTGKAVVARKPLPAPAMPAAGGPSGAPPPPPPPPGLRGPPPPPAFGKKADPETPQKRLRPLRWSAIPAHKIKSTIWGKVQASTSGLGAHEQELESLFSLSPVKKDSGTIKVGNKVIKKVRAILPIKRTNNIAIVLSRIPGSCAGIREAILRSEGAAELNGDQLFALRGLLPVTKEEQQVVSKFAKENPEEELMKSERFVLELASVARPVEKIDCQLFMTQYQELHDEAQESIRTIVAACEEVQESERLPKLLELILSLGSVLNRNTYLSSRGFRLESLLALADTRDKTGKFTFLDYLGKVAKESAPELLHFIDDLPHCLEASDIATERILSHMKQIKKKMEIMRQEVAAMEAEQKCELAIYRYVHPFYERHAPEAAALLEELQAMQETFQKVCTYFGEEPSSHLTTTTFFSILRKFSTSLTKVPMGKTARLISQLQASKEQTDPQVAAVEPAA